MVDCLHGSTVFVKTSYMGLFYGRLLTWVYHLFVKTSYMGLFCVRLLTWVYHLFVKTSYMGLLSVDCLHGSTICL